LAIAGARHRSYPAAPAAGGEILAARRDCRSIGHLTFKNSCGAIKVSSSHNTYRFKSEKILVKWRQKLYFVF
jgi:hypothetical protein